MIVTIALKMVYMFMNTTKSRFQLGQENVVVNVAHDDVKNINSNLTQSLKQIFRFHNEIVLFCFKTSPTSIYMYQSNV